MIHLKIEGIKFKNSFSMYVLLISPLVFLCFAISQSYSPKVIREQRIVCHHI